MAKENVSARIDEELIKILKELAKKENRTVSNYLEMIIQKHIERKTGRTGT